MEAAGYETGGGKHGGYGSSGSFTAGRVSRIKTKDNRGYCFGGTRVRDRYVFMHMPYGNWIMLAFTIPVMAFFGRDFLFMPICS